jgi:hypothetical protein
MEKKRSVRSNRRQRAKRGWVGIALLAPYALLRGGDVLLTIIGFGGVSDDLAVWNKWLEGWPPFMENAAEAAPLVALAWLLYWTFSGRVIPSFARGLVGRVAGSRHAGSSSSGDTQRAATLGRLCTEGHELAALFRENSSGHHTNSLVKSARAWQCEATELLGPSAAKRFKVSAVLPVQTSDIRQWADVLHNQCSVLRAEQVRLAEDGGASSAIDAFRNAMGGEPAVKQLEMLLRDYPPGSEFRVSHVAAVMSRYRRGRGVDDGMPLDLSYATSFVAAMTDLGLAVEPSAGGNRIDDSWNRRVTEKAGDVLQAFTQSASHES